MLLEHKVALIHGGGGAIGGAVARAFAREGAQVHLAGRSRAKLERVAADIVAAGGRAEIAILDALDQNAVDAHAAAVAETAGAIDIALNAVGIAHVQGTPFAELSLQDYLQPIADYSRSNFITAQAAARHMPRGGAILTLSTPGSRMSGVGFLGYGTTCAAIEAFSRLLAAELGGAGIRVVCLRPDAIPEALPVSYARAVFEGYARRSGATVDAMLEARAHSGTLLGRFPTLAQVADYAAFVASDRAGAMTGAIANLSCGSLVD
ncbi:MULTISPECIES: SDR family oxidoreductase [unclassified Lysobacter]|uniref:SDR family NAD(P)-dependent oxidoreductase n=1 Tax=unclassified Lysobacter TaxID=2635362 RepID=UPI0006F378DE|nr:MULTISPECIES: SDR family oxidoreductase [unclassified Lysobacter]KRC33679.1 short-chain dehydrogenase [Lysobacter sp. Root76]KRD69016.1 short-chain dehydrogenase [Lysobacter sp. Root96]